MEKIEEIVNEICKKNNYDEMLLEIVKKGKEPVGTSTVPSLEKCTA